MITLYTFTCHCGVTKQTPRPRQRACSKRCAQHTPEAHLRNRRAGQKGGKASGIIRAKHKHSAGYRHGYNAGWIAGRRHGFAEALGEKDQRPFGRSAA